MKDSKNDEYGKNIQKVFEGRKMNSKEKLLIKVGNLTRLVEIQQEKLRANWDLIELQREKIKQYEEDDCRKEFLNMKKQKNMWEKKWHDLNHEFNKWKKIKFGK